MPLEIKELHIRVTVNQPQAGSNAPPASDTSAQDDDKDGVIRQCIEQVVDMINAKNER
jgi:hypothetical protein